MLPGMSNSRRLGLDRGVGILQFDSSPDLNQQGDGVLLESPDKSGKDTRCTVKSPIIALEEYARGRSLDVSFELINQHGTPHNPRYMIAACVGGRRFQPAVRADKESGRQEAADIALRQLLEEKPKNSMQTPPQTPPGRQSSPSRNLSGDSVNCDFCHRRTQQILCRACGHCFLGRVRGTCAQHSAVIHLMDVEVCPCCLSSSLKEFADSVLTLPTKVLGRHSAIPVSLSHCRVRHASGDRLRASKLTQ